MKAFQLLLARIQMLEAEVERCHDVLRAECAARWFDRFHAFDAIKNDACPACGGRVRVIEEMTGENGGHPQGIRLEAAT